MFDEPKTISEAMVNFFMLTDDEYGIRERMIKAAKQVTDMDQMLEVLLMEFPITSSLVRDFVNYIQYNWFKEQYGNEWVLALERRSFPHVYNTVLLQAIANINDGRDSVQLKWLADALGGIEKLPMFTYIPRWRAEYNPNYVHFIVSGLIHTIDDMYIVLRRKYGVFADKLTMVQGHCSYSDSLTDISYYPLNMLSLDVLTTTMTSNLRREVKEEVGITDMTFSESYLYRLPKLKQPKSISYYHAGFLFTVEADVESSRVTSKEPDRNEVVVLTERELRDMPRSKTDEWLKDYTDYLFQ